MEDPFSKLSSIVWYALAVAFLCVFVGAPYFLFFEHLPEFIQLWVGPRWLFVFIIVFGYLIVQGASKLKNVFNKTL